MEEPANYRITVTPANPGATHQITASPAPLATGVGEGTAFLPSQDTPHQAKDYLRSLTIRPEFWSVSSYYPDDVEAVVEGLLAHAATLTTQLQEAEAARVTGIQGVLREWRDEELARAEEDLSGSLRWEVQDLMHQSFDLKSRELTGQPLPAEAAPLPDLPAPPHQEEGEKEVAGGTGWCARCTCPVFGGGIHCSTCAIIVKNKAK